MSDMTFTWKGVSSADMGVQVLRLPDVIRAARRGTTYKVPGRDGALFVDDGALEEITLLMECYLPYDQGDKVSDMSVIREWLTGDGEFTQSDLPGRVFKARITDEIKYQPWVQGFADRVFGVTLYAEPYCYSDVPEYIEFSSAGGEVTNPGDAMRPVIIIEGSGDITLTVDSARREGEYFASFEGLTDGVLIDCDAMECLSTDRTQLLNDKATMDEFPILEPGRNFITCTGNVERISVIARWRWA